MLYYVIFVADNKRAFVFVYVYHVLWKVANGWHSWASLILFPFLLLILIKYHFSHFIAKMIKEITFKSAPWYCYHSSFIPEWLPIANANCVRSAVGFLLRKCTEITPENVMKLLIFALNTHNHCHLLQPTLLDGPKLARNMWIKCSLNAQLEREIINFRQTLGKMMPIPVLILSWIRKA